MIDWIQPEINLICMDFPTGELYCKVIAGEAHNKYKIMKIQIQIQTKIQVQGEGGRQEMNFSVQFLY